MRNCQMQIATGWWVGSLFSQGYPHFHEDYAWGSRVPIIATPVHWGPRSQFYCYNGDPWSPFWGSPFYLDTERVCERERLWVETIHTSFKLLPEINPIIHNTTTYILTNNGPWCNYGMQGSILN